MMASVYEHFEKSTAAHISRRIGIANPNRLANFMEYFRVPPELLCVQSPEFLSLSY